LDNKDPNVQRSDVQVKSLRAARLYDRQTWTLSDSHTESHRNVTAQCINKGSDEIIVMCNISQKRSFLLKKNQLLRGQQKRLEMPI